MPFIMLDDCSNKSPLLSYTLKTEEPQTSDWIFSRCSEKPDLLGEDLGLRQQCRQQRCNQTEDEEERVCDLNRHSPAPVNVNDQRDASALAPLLLSRNEMTITTENTNASLTTSPAADAIFLDRTHIALLSLLRQLSRVTQRAGTIFQLLSKDIGQINEQSERLKSRLQTLQAHVDPLLGAKVPNPGASAGLVRYTNVKKHFRSTAKDSNRDKGGRCRLFTPVTRPFAIVGLYEEADVDPSRKHTLPSTTPVEHCATQTDNNDVRPSGTKQPMTSGRTDSFVQDIVPSNDGDKPLSKCILNHSSTSNLLRQDPATGSGLHCGEVQRQHSLASCTFVGTNGEILSSTSSGRKCAPDAQQASRGDVSSSNTTTGDVIAPIPVEFDTSTAAARCTTKIKPCNSQFGGLVKLDVAVVEYGSDRKRRAARYCRSNRRNTVAGFEANCVVGPNMVNDAVANGGSYETEGHSNRNDCDLSERVISTTGDSLANEVVYEFAPFHRRKSRRLLNTTGNIFSSLRRLKKDKRDIPTPLANSTPTKGGATKKDATVSSFHHSKNDTTSSKQSDSWMSTPAKGEGDDCPKVQNSSNSALNSLKQLFRRSASLRRSKRAKDPPNTEMSSFTNSPSTDQPSSPYSEKSLDQEDTKNRNFSPPCAFSRNYAWKAKTNLPISTTSQVIHLATHLRDCPTQKPIPCDIGGGSEQRFSKISSSSRDSAYSSCKKLRPPSTVSLVSLDFTESKVNGWYRQGYQLEYPEECVAEDGTHGRHNHAAAQLHVPPVEKMANTKPKFKPALHPHVSRDTSNSSPYSDASSFVDSNYSCDPEGYFTTMHRDCGLRQGADKAETERETNGRIPSSETSCSSSMTTVEPIGQSISQPIGKETQYPPANRYRPGALSLSPSGLLPLGASSSPPPLSAASESEVKFDLWLMSKFYAEQRVERFRQKLEQEESEGAEQQLLARTLGHFSLPRSRKVQRHVKNSIVADYLKSLGCEDKQPRVTASADYSCTLPRKSVRFRE